MIMVCGRVSLYYDIGDYPYHCTDFLCMYSCLCSPQPSTSGRQQRKRKKHNPSTNNSESGSSVGDDVSLRRSSRRSKKAKPNAT